MTDKDVQSLCELCKVTGRQGLNFADVVMMVGYVEMASNTLGGIAKIYQDEKDAIIRKDLEQNKQSQGLFGMLGGAVSDSQQEFQRSSQQMSNSFNAPSFEGMSGTESGVGSGISNAFSNASEGLNQSSSYFTIGGVNAASLAAAAVAEAENAAVSASNAANAVLNTGNGNAEQNRRVLVKQKKLADATKKAKELKELAARSTGEEAARATALHQQAANDPIFSKQVIGNWFKAKAGGMPIREI